MVSSEQQFAVGTRVRLRDGVDPSFYQGFSRTGNEGWIRKRRFDKYGYAQVFIEFDKNHWAHNGAQDGWTWQAHWTPIEENKMNESIQQNDQPNLEEHIKALTETFVTTLFETILPITKNIEATSSSQSIEENSTESKKDDPNKWENLAEQAIESVVNSPAYFVLTLESIESPGAPPMIIPRVFHAASKPEYELIVQSNLAHVLVALQDENLAAILDEQKSTDGDE